jgi:hypothetical protein
LPKIHKQFQGFITFYALQNDYLGSICHKNDKVL